MLNTLRHILPFGLLIAFFALIFNYLLFTGFIETQKSQLQSLSISEAKVENISIDVSDLYKNKNGITWRENNSEIFVNNNYFEVVQIRKAGSKVIITIAKDEKENKLNADFFSSQKKNNEMLSLLVKLFFNLNLNTNPVESPSDEVLVDFVKRYPVSDNWIDPNYFFKRIKPPQLAA